MLWDFVWFGCPEVASELVRDVFEFFDFFLFIIMTRNIDYKSILQKTLKQFRLVASKYERILRYKSNFQCVSLRRGVCLICRAMFIQSAFQFGFLPSNPCLFPVRYSLEFVLHRGKPKLLVCRLNFPPIDQNFTSVLRRSIIIFTRTELPCFCFYFSKSSGRTNAKYAFQYTFQNNITQHAKKKKKERTK